MKEILLSPAGLIKIVTVITLFYAFIKLKKNSEINKYVLLLLSLNFLTELINSILIVNKYPIRTVTTMSIYVHQIIWFLILIKLFESKKLITYSLFFFTVFGITNFIAIEKSNTFNYYTFVFGALFYVILFNYESFNQLKKENFPFFKSNHFLLAFSPVLFFLGMSLLLAFKSYSLTSSQVIGSLTLYNIINIFVNLIYYILLNIYIFKESVND